MISLDDLKYLILVDQHQTLRQSAAAAKVSPSTLARHIDRLESMCNVKLVERLADGCCLTEGGLRVLEYAKKMEKLSNELLTSIAEHRSDDISGIVRINTDEWISYLLNKEVRLFHEKYPKVRLEILTSHRPYNLMRREADIAIRHCIPKASDLVCRKLGILTSGLFCSKNYANSHEQAINAKQWSALDFIGFDQRLHEAREERWLHDLDAKVCLWLRASYALGIYDGIKNDCGIGILRSFIARDDESIFPIIENIKDLDQEVWMSMHKGLKLSPRIRVTIDFLVDCAAEWLDH